MTEPTLELRPADRLTGRDLLREIDRRHREDLAAGTWARGVPARAKRPWWMDPRYGA